MNESRGPEGIPLHHHTVLWTVRGSSRTLEQPIAGGRLRLWLSPQIQRTRAYVWQPLQQQGKQTAIVGAESGVSIRIVRSLFMMTTRRRRTAVND